jgi:hypothetical protein
MLKLAPEEQAILLRDHPQTFEPSAGAWGRQGCTNVRLATADRRAVKAAARLAWDGVLRLPPPRKRAPAAGRGRAAPRATPRRRVTR